MAKYKKVNDLGTLDCIHDKENNKFIPLDLANTDYQEYLEWISEGNTPEAAD